MNFEMAAEMVQAEGLTVGSVLIDDDVAVKDSLYTQGRRGVGTTVLAEKICGAAAEEGISLRGLIDLCHRVNSGGRSMGMALTPCTVPAAGTPSFELSDGEMEIGIGIHGEPGRERLAVRPADEVVEMLLTAIIEDPVYERTVSEWDPEEQSSMDRTLVDAPFAPGDRVLLFLNGMGGTPLSELYLLYRKAEEVAANRGLRVERRLIGNFITSLEMQGFSVTLLRLDEEMVSYWDAPVLTSALRWGC
jgi:dihydroxyacetone kinase-like protein